MERITLAVDCHERWADMAPCAGGRFCGSCAKPVIDFTTWSRVDLLRYLEQHPKSCGRYLPEQLDPSLMPLSVVTTKARRGFFAALAAVALNSAAQAQDGKPVQHTEQTTADEPSAPGVQQEIVPVELRNGKPVCLRPEPVVHVMNKRPMRWYISSRFPFVHKRRRVVMGAWF